MCHFYGCAPGSELSTADGVQAYVQATLGGKPTYVEIPRAHWPCEWVRRGYRRPVVPLVKALYGHPNAGAFWESECRDRVLALGYLAFEAWPSVLASRHQNDACGVCG